MKNQSTPSAGIPGTILCQAHDRPPGVSLLDAMVHQYEKDTGRKSQLPAATVAKLEGASPKNDISKRLSSFLESGKHAMPYTQSDSRALLDACRDLILTNRRPLPTPAATPRTAAATPRPVATTTPAPAPSAPAAVTAAQFATVRPSMTLQEFNKMTPSDKMRFSTSGGKLV